MESGLRINNLPHVLDIRKKFEKKEVNQQLLVSLYQKYNPKLKQPKLFVQRAIELFPVGCCGLASLYLQHMLQPNAEIVQGSYEGNNHTFLRNGSIIIDITADQFGGPKIFYDFSKPPCSLKKN